MKNDSNDADRARRGRNVMIALGLVAFVILIFVVTYVRLQGNLGARPL